MPRLRLRRGQLDELLLLARRESPNEAVALLFGLMDGDVWSVEEVMPMRNSLMSPYAFSIAPEDLYRAYVWAERMGLELVGIFHSHMGEPYPSPVDVRYMKLNPVVWVISGRGASECRAFIINGDSPSEVELEVRT